MTTVLAHTHRIQSIDIQSTPVSALEYAFTDVQESPSTTAAAAAATADGMGEEVETEHRPTRYQIPLHCYVSTNFAT